MEEFYPIFSKCPLLTNIKENEYDALFHCINTHIKNFRPNEYIFLTGNTVNYIGIVLSGTVAVIKENPAGAKYIMDFLEPSNIFAEGIVFTHERVAPVTVQAKEASSILFIPYEGIIKNCSNACCYHTQLTKNLIMIMGEKNYNLNYKIDLLMLKGMREKLATFLLYEFKLQNSLTFQIKLNRNELADYLNVSRPSMCRELARMKDLDILDYYQNSFKILSLDKLKACLF